MSGITSFSATAADSAINLHWEVSASLINIANITKITITLNDFGANPMQQYNVTPVLYTDPQSGVVSRITQDFTITSFNGTALQNGVEYGAAILINTLTESYSFQLAQAIKPLSVPNKPVINVIATESKIHIKILNYEPNEHGSTGFSNLTGINVFISEATTKYFKLIQLDPTTHFGDDLKGTHSLVNGQGGVTITNGKTYEVALQSINSLGPSPISDTKTVTPNDLPGEITDKVPVAMPKIVFDGESVAKTVILFGDAVDQSSLLGAGIPILNYKVFRYDVNSSNQKTGTRLDIATITLDPSGLSSTPDASYNFNNVNYPFKVEDSSVILGTRYIYTIAGTNINGEGVETPTGIVRAGRLADAPTITLTPTNGDVLASAVRPVNLGGFPSLGGLDSSNVFHYTFRYTWLSPDASGQLVERATVDSSAASVSSGIQLTNGVTYTVRAQSLTYYGQEWVGAAVSATSVPYGPADPPTTVTLYTRAPPSGGPLNGAIQVNWSAVTNKNGSTGALTYSVLVQDSSSIMQVVAFGITGTQYTLNSLTNGQSYVITVRADVFNTEINASVPGTQSAQQTAVPFRLPSDVSNLRVERPSSSSFDIKFDVCGNITGKPDSQVVSEIYVREYNSDNLTFSGNSNTYYIYGTGAKTQAYSGTTGKAYQINVTSGIQEVSGGTVYYNGTPQTISRTMFDKPDAPLAFNVQPLSEGFRVTWNAPANLKGTTLTGYRIARGFGGAVTIQILGTETEYFIASGYANDVVINGGISMFTRASAPFETNPIESVAAGPIAVTPKAAPSQPQNLTAAGEDGKVKLTWTKDNDVTGYQITQDDNPTYISAYGQDGSGWTFSNPSTVSFLASGLTNGTSYNFKVSAYKISSGANIFSTDASITAVPFAAPSAPQNLTCSVDSQSITSNWSAPSSTAGAGLGNNGPILYRLTIDASYLDASSLPVTTNILNQTNISASQIPFTFSSSSLLNDKMYIVRVFAYFINSDNPLTPYESPAAGPVVVVVNPPPQDVSGLTITPGNMKVELKWTNPTDTVTYPRTGIDIYENGIFLTTLLASDTSYNKLNLSNGGLYTYKVVSKHSAQAQQPPGATISGIPFGKPILMSVTPNSANNLTYTLTLNKNGSNLKDYVAIGALNDASGNIAIPVLQGTVGNVSYGGNSGSIVVGGQTTYYAAGQLYDLTLTMGSTVNGVFVPTKVESVLAIIENGAGFTTKTIPTGSNTSAFGQL